MLAAYWVTTAADTLAEDGLTSLREVLHAAQDDDAAFVSFAASLGDSPTLRLDPTLGALPSITGHLFGGTVADDGTLHNAGRTITLDAGGHTRFFTVEAGQTLRLTGLTLTRGHAETGGAIAIASGGRLELDGVTLHANAATGFGGAIANEGEMLLLETALRDNAAAAGGAIASSGQAWLDDVTLAGNTATSGGALFVHGGAATLLKSRLTENTAAEVGGGLAVNRSGAALHLADSSLVANAATRRGGAIALIAGHGHLVRTQLVANAATEGGALDVSGSLAMQQTSLRENRAGSRGAALAIASTGSVDGEVVGFRGNSAASGGAAIDAAGRVRLAEATFTDHRGDSAVWAGEAAQVRLEATTFVRTIGSDGAARPHWAGTGYVGSLPADELEPHRVVYRDGGSLDIESDTVDVYRSHEADTAAPAVLLVHGGGWRGGSSLDVATQARELAAEGLVVVAVNTRKLPGHTVALEPTAATLAEMVADVRQAHRFARDQAAVLGLDPRRLALAGVSAGGQLAAAVALELAEAGTPPAALLVQSAVLRLDPQTSTTPDSPHTIGSAETALTAAEVGDRDRWSPLHRMLDWDHTVALPPLFVQHGDRDEMAPPESATALAAAWREAGGAATEHVVQGGDHALRLVDPTLTTWPDASLALHRRAFATHVKNAPQA